MAENKAERCPICGKPTDPAVRPFCSPRCADLDLQRWLSDRYVLPGEDEADPSGQSEERHL